MAFIEFSKNREVKLFIPKEEEEGIVRIGEKVAEDIEKTVGILPQIIRTPKSCPQAVIAVTAGSGEAAELLAQRIPLLKEVQGKREVYGFFLADNPCPGVKTGLVIYGSDKLGTIYGLFHLSELLGVSPCTFWGDAGYASYKKVCLVTKGEAEREKEEGCLMAVADNKVSKEPSVKYRGFFINDEWPCFGNWTFSHYGGFTAQMYDRVFEYLLRMKGNYLWPAMWTSSFFLDGPGMASMELADMYGIYIGMSHHEPCMRSSEEWDLVKGEDTPYGTRWSYVTNKEGLLNYWEDGLKRAKGHKVFPTIGMRGERDSKMLGDDADVSENVRLLKEIITNQQRMIKEHLEADGEEVPRLFAVYKEVEDYYFGEGRAEGLCDFEELEGVTLLLCEDNFGNMRALPNPGEGKSKGSFGMYYHLDYHGGPVSYEWVASTPLTKIWEQMTMAYEYGVRDLWIVNAGDLKFQEYPLNYFMELAYDFETWGSSAKNKTKEYTKLWVKQQFGAYTSKEEQERIGKVTEEYIRINHLRRPEACNASVYHPVHFYEGRRMLERCQRLKAENDAILELLKARNKEKAYYSMIYYPAQASANLLEMHLYGGFNRLYAKQGKAEANVMGEKLLKCIEEDKRLAEEMREFEAGKWAGMELAEHIGFQNWNSEDWRYPVRHVVTLPPKPRLTVSKGNQEAHFTNQYFPVPVVVDEFLESDTDKAVIQVANGGEGILSFEIKESCDWLKLSAVKGETRTQEELVLTVDREKLRKEEETFTFQIRAKEEMVPVCVKAGKRKKENLPEHTCIAQNGIFVFEAVEYANRTEGSYKGRPAQFEPLYDFGKYGTGMKVFPVTASFKDMEEAPGLSYHLFSEEQGEFWAEVHTSPANPLVYGGSLSLGISWGDEKAKRLEITGKDYKGGDNACPCWEEAVLRQEHVAKVKIQLKKGLNTITVYGQEAGIAVERLLVYGIDKKVEESYLGPEAGYTSL